MPHTLVSFLGQACQGPNIDTYRAYWMLKKLRNGLALGNPEQIEHYRRIIANPQRLRREGAMGRILNTTNKG